MSVGLSRGERAAVAILLLLGAWLRLRHVATAFLFGDEMYSFKLLLHSYREVIATFDRFGSSGQALPLLQKLSIDLFGTHLTALRLPSLVPALATLGLLPLLGVRLVSPRGAVFATAFLSASAIHVYYARFCRGYALAALFALAFVAATHRVIAEERPRLRHYLLFGVLGGLLVWTHLSTMAFVAAIGVAALVSSALAAPRRERVAPLLGALGLAAGIAVLVHLPDARQVMDFVTAKQQRQYAGQFGIADVAAVLAGGHAGGVILLLAVPIATAWLLWQRGLAQLPLATAAIAPLPLVFAAQPFGDPYAYARYAVVALPAAALVLGEVVAQALVAAGAVRAMPVLAIVLAGVLAAAGPLRATEDGPHANTYLAMLPLPAFDVPDPAMPDFYRRLEPEAVIVEAPALMNRSRQLYRNYFLQHRHDTLIGFLPEEAPVPPGPHVLVGPPWDLDHRADYLVLHRNVGAEVDRYWRFVDDVALPRVGGSPALMAWQATYGRPTLRRPTQALIELLDRRYGAPVYTDAAISAYRLPRARSARE